MQVGGGGGGGVHSMESFRSPGAFHPGLCLLLCLSCLSMQKRNRAQGEECEGPEREVFIRAARLGSGDTEQRAPSLGWWLVRPRRRERSPSGPKLAFGPESPEKAWH